MREPRYPSRDEIRNLIEQLDEMCREAERVRHQVEEGLRQPAHWPGHRRSADENNTDVSAA